MMDFVIVTEPNPPGSRQSISPPAVVCEMAPAKVLHGAVRLQGFASSPTPETHVRVDWALAAKLNAIKRVAANIRILWLRIFIGLLLFLFGPHVQYYIRRISDLSRSHHLKCFAKHRYPPAKFLVKLIGWSIVLPAILYNS